MLTYYCSNCWEEVAPNTAICPFCGYDIKNAPSATDYVDKLIASLEHPVSSTPVRAAWILGRLKAKKALPALARTALLSKDLFIQKAAIGAIGEIGDRAYLVFMQQFISPAYSFLIRKEAADAVKKLKENAAPEP